MKCNSRDLGTKCVPNKDEEKPQTKRPAKKEPVVVSTRSESAKAERQRPGGVRRPRVLVVGGGVSGCACAATLAGSGVEVTLINNALDGLGQPGYGPVVAVDEGWDGLVETLSALPPALRAAWLDASTAGDEESPFFYVDRRMLSIETKRALEDLPGLELRQALVTDIRSASDLRAASEGVSNDKSGRIRPVVVGTAFGESIGAEAAVLAVGLSLEGEVRVGDDVLPGGRYGETRAGGLREALERMGASFQGRTMDVGPWFPMPCEEQWKAACSLERSPTGERTTGGCDRRSVATRPLRDLLVALERKRLDTPRRECDGRREQIGADDGDEIRRDPEMVMRNLGSPTTWPDNYPPAPHWIQGLHVGRAILHTSSGGHSLALLSPDGVATGEMYLSEGESHRSEEDGPGGRCVSDGGYEPTAFDGSMASRPGHRVAGLILKTFGRGGRLAVGQDSSATIWVTGRAGGATGYLESLASGVRVARDVKRVLSVHADSDGWI